MPRAARGGTHRCAQSEGEREGEREGPRASVQLVLPIPVVLAKRCLASGCRRSPATLSRTSRASTCPRTQWRVATPTKLLWPPLLALASGVLSRSDPEASALFRCCDRCRPLPHVEQLPDGEEGRLVRRLTADHG